MRGYSFAILGLAAMLVFPAGLQAQGTITQLSTNVSGSGTSITGGAAWCWFCGPNVFYDQGNVIATWMTVDGKEQVATNNLGTSATTYSYLNNGNVYEADDHDYAALLKTSDGRYTAFYVKHAVDGLTTAYQTATTANSTAAWGSVQHTNTNIAGTYGATYSNPIAAPWDATGNTVYNFWRGGDFNPAYSSSTYNPTAHTFGTWSTAATLITNASQRPYVKYMSNSTSIGFTFTDAHPDNTTNNNVYFAFLAKNTSTGQVCYYKPGSSTAIQALGTAIAPSQASLVYTDTDPNSSAGNAWVWDSAYTSDGRPVIAYSVANGGTYPHQSLYWAVWNGTGWTTRTLVADAGGPITHNVNPKQPYYTGGIALDPNNPYTVYVSAKTNPSDTANKFQLSQIKVDAADPLGAFDSKQVITSSTTDNIRPRVPENLPVGVEAVTWMSGTYNDYANVGAPQYTLSNTNGTGVGYSTVVDMWVQTPEPVSLTLMAFGSLWLLRRRSAAK